MAITYHGQHNTGANTSPGALNIGDDTGANFVLGYVSWYAGITTDVFLSTDSISSTYSTTSKYTTAIPTSIRIWYTNASQVGGAGHTITWAGSDTYCAYGASAWAGVNYATDPRDQESGATASGTNVITLPSLTPSEDNCLVVTALSFEDNSSGAVSITGGWTILDTVAWGSGNHEGLSFAYQIQTTATACAPQWNVTNNTSLAAVMAIFKGPGGGGGGGGGFGPLLGGQRNRMILGG